MSYALSAALQAAIYQHLANDAALQALVGSNVFDAMPEGSVPALYVLLGQESVRDASDVSGRGSWHDLGVSVVTASAGFQTAKDAAAAICDALIDAPLALTRGRLVGMAFRRARAVRASGGVRRIDLTFRARVDDG
ncbi:DUF3168 domain-containing protein [Thalassococcus sp. CAU 1522]|uniref:DUF3168 domain-containing protein n=1 Tax=Thalassococcus arenae TaxID=2851652 RepID=A0ABS6NBD3_9RHOB|nr:DUF3168 domain-containing protein [Thalassococcus arenae]MBV2361327.1 DUF3168 domain-containing protein [Thalassococcus arenae]